MTHHRRTNVCVCTGIHGAPMSVYDTSVVVRYQLGFINTSSCLPQCSSQCTETGSRFWTCKKLQVTDTHSCVISISMFCLSKHIELVMFWYTLFLTFSYHQIPCLVALQFTPWLLCWSFAYFCSCTLLLKRLFAVQATDSSVDWVSTRPAFTRWFHIQCY